MESPETEKKPNEGSGKGIPGLKPPNPDDLPREYLSSEERAERDKKEGLYGDFKQAREEKLQEAAENKIDEDAKNWITQISAQAGRDMAYYAGLTEYEIEFDDGKTKKYKRISPIDYQWDELEDLRAEIEGGEAMDDGHKLSRREKRLKEKLYDQLKAKYFFEPSITPDMKAHIRRSDKFGAICDSLILCGLHKAVVGKK